MQLLTGKYYHTIDAKNRIRIPSKLRDDILERMTKPEDEDKKEEKVERFSLIFHLGTGNCIEVYTQEKLNEIYEKFANIKQSDTEMFKAVRQYMSTFETVVSDPQGRMVVPPAFKAYARINKDIVICGNVDHIEIWSKEIYDDYCKDVNVNDLVKILGI